MSLKMNDQSFKNTATAIIYTPYASEKEIPQLDGSIINKKHFLRQKIIPERRYYSVTANNGIKRYPYDKYTHFLLIIQKTQITRCILLFFRMFDNTIAITPREAFWYIPEEFYKRSLKGYVTEIINLFIDTTLDNIIGIPKYGDGYPPYIDQMMKGFGYSFYTYENYDDNYTAIRYYKSIDSEPTRPNSPV